MGSIYFIYCRMKDIDKVYVGQTTGTIGKRWSEHQASARRLIKARGEGKEIPNIHNSVLYRAMAFHGISHYSIELLEVVEDEEKLNETEVYWIKEFDCIAPKGYNLTNGGGSGYHHAPQTIALMMQVKQSRVDNYRNPKLLGLPAKTAYRIDPDKGETIHINGHHLCKSKMYYVRDYPSFEATKEAVIEFLANLAVPYERKKQGQDEQLPKGLQKTPKGYRVNKMFQGHTYDRKFESPNRTLEQNKQAALDCYEALMENRARND